MWYPQRSEDGIKSSGTVLTDSCQSLCGYWEQTCDLQHRAIFPAPIITFNLHYYSMNLGQQELCVTKEEMLKPLSYHQWTLELEHQ